MRRAARLDINIEGGMFIYMSKIKVLERPMASPRPRSLTCENFQFDFLACNLDEDQNVLILFSELIKLSTIKQITCKAQKTRKSGKIKLGPINQPRDQLSHQIGYLLFFFFACPFFSFSFSSATMSTTLSATLGGGGEIGPKFPNRLGRGDP